ncbi:FG-GAP-like repeat-containing protein [Myxococcus sp. RHSTA-1-4]|uniref:FG-GAP-like repeat-containing protein n=1 Tax=Myxococcus sp. RHSTA-1-4 TaxID=2874601 RepID=UPI001CBFE10E|nr:FG-GAP-like repeat-containing protein [Myxococcus sp. RHSTA-1-4]MBZ4419115.1 FG-GAP-like repeat-containing protein [Myxococcus sp. RHSTA-1-4]
MTPTKLSSRALLLLLGAWLTTGCINPVSEGERPCPCAEGWTCCPDEQVCVADATRCRLPRPPAASTPSAPRSVEVTPSVRAVSLGWSAPEKDGGSPITGYQVDVEPLELGMVVTVDGLTAQVTGLRAGATYRFIVAARNEAGVGASVSTADVRLPDVPQPPESLAVERGDGQVRVTWERPPSDGGLGLLGYVVTAHPRGLTVEAGPSEKAAVVGGLTNGEAATFTVRALNPVGASAESEPSAPVVPARAPDAPASVSAVPGVRSASVSWKAPADTGGLPVSGYVVTAMPGGASQQVDGAATSASFTGLEDDTAYTFTVAARNEVGPGGSAGTEPILTPTRPGAPALVEAKPGVRSITVSWEPPASDGRAPLTGFTVTASPSNVRVDVGPQAREVTLEEVPSTKEQTVTVVARNAVGEGAGGSIRRVKARPAPVEVTRLEVPSEDGDCRSVSYDLRQVDGERADVVVAVDVKGDGTFTRAVQAGSTTHSGLVALATSADGAEHSFRWNRARDVPGATETTRVRVTATVPGTTPSTRMVTVALPAATRRCEVDLDSGPLQWVPEETSWTAYDMTQGDFDRDGKLDLVVIHSGGQGASLLRGLGNGGFDRMRSAGSSLSGYSVSSGDLDQDGLLDLVILAPFASTGLKVARGSGGGFFDAPVTTQLLGGTAQNEPTAPLVRDLDGDGAPEVVVSQDRILFVLRHTGGGALAVAERHSFTPSGPVVGGDFDQDGREDLLVVGEFLEAFYGKGLLSFTPEHLGNMASKVTSAVSADFNRDGYPDLAAIVMESEEMVIQLRLNDGEGRFEAPVVLLRHDRVSWDKESRLAVGDLDGNGTQDLAYAHMGREVVSLLRGQGDGTFELQDLPSGRYPKHIAAADFDGSGGLDLVLLSMSQNVRVLRDLQVPTQAEPGKGFITADFDGDGWDDVASLVGNTGVQVHLTRATGDMVARGPFPTREGPWKLLAGRFDAGPTMDLLVLTSDGSRPVVRTLMLMRGNGDGTFATGEDLAPGMSPTLMAAGDIDGDGDLDVVITDWRQVDGVSSLDVRLLRGTGDGTFTPGGVLANHSSVNELAMGDLNKDGRADLVVNRNVYPAFELGIFQGRADGTLTKVRDYSPVISNCAASRMLFQDLDADGHMDVTVSCAGATAGVLPLWGQSQFWFYTRDFHSTTGNASGLAARDIDGDGSLDLLVASPGHEAVCVIPSPRDGAFRAHSCFGALPYAHDVVLLDMEHDGVPELLVGGAFGVSTLLHLK